MDLKIIEPIRKPLKQFDSVEEFNLYYHKHKADMDNETTHLLNKKFKIEGYRITKIKGVICLKKDRGDKNKQADDLIQRLEILEQKVNEIIEFINPTDKE